MIFNNYTMTHYMSVLKNELQELYNKLKKLLDERHEIDGNIALVEMEIEKMLKKKLTLERQ